MTPYKNFHIQISKIIRKFATSDQSDYEKRYLCIIPV